MRTSMPTVAQVRELAELVRLHVPPEWEDINGHVNVQHYLGMYDQSGPGMLALLGVDDGWIRTERIGIIDLEHHIWFQDEVHVGDEVTVHALFTARNARRTQGVVFIVNVTRDRVAAAIEFVSAAANLDTRRTVPLPEPIASRLDALILRQRALAWQAPRSGTISI